jgi:hypothetical protein
MKLFRAFMLTITPVLADITVFSCILCLITSSRDEGMLALPLVAFVICTAAVSLINCVLIRWLRNLIPIVLFNLVLAVLCAGILLSMLGNVTTGLYAVCTLLFIYPAFRCPYLVLRPPPTNTMMLYSQAAFFGIGCYLFLQHNDYFRPGWGLTALCFISQAMNLGLLLYLRFEEQRTRFANTGGPERFLIPLFKAGIMLAMGILLAVFMLPETREMLMRGFNHAINILFWMLAQLLRLLDFLLSLLFGSKEYGDAVFNQVNGGLISGRGIGQREIEAHLFVVVIFWLLCAVLFIWMFKWIVNSIKSRLRTIPSNNVQKINETSFNFWSYIKIIMFKCINHFRYCLLLLVHFRQPAGVFARLERRGKACGHPRLAGQTPRDFLEMINRRLAPEETDACEALMALAEYLDILCFRDGKSLKSKKTKKTVTAYERRVMLRAVRSL